jgi:hypothetical protein
MLITFQVHDLPTTHQLPPHYLEIPIPDYNQFTLGRAAQQVMVVLVAQVVAGCQLHFL